ncbi:OmpW family outer membrane protein [Microbulbifer sp. THAF38]|uniref:OmpW family outer membrane protein n=1 Tax=Microbulbifer sp. THAF38 TaxID=2587856 RepID=UPI001268D1C9|nr:Outer membrane protein W precursor [Microbulbifer sp. THAF38]
MHYTHFFSEHINHTAQNYFGIVLGAESLARWRVDNSWGLAGEVGTGVAFGRDSRWLFNTTIWYLDIDAEAEIHLRSGLNVRSRIHLDIDVDCILIPLFLLGGWIPLLRS